MKSIINKEMIFLRKFLNFKFTLSKIKESKYLLDLLAFDLPFYSKLDKCFNC